MANSFIEVRFVVRHETDDGGADGGAAFRRLYRENQDFVWRMLGHFGVPAPLLDDALQDVFIVVYRRLPEYDRTRPLRSWLWGIARRVASTHERTARRAARRTEAPYAAGHVPMAPDAQAEARQAARFLEVFLAKLPLRHREVFFLSEVEGFGAQEIAETLDVKVGTVYSRLHTARERFAHALASAQVRGAETKP